MLGCAELGIHKHSEHAFAPSELIVWYSDNECHFIRTSSI